MNSHYRNSWAISNNGAFCATKAGTVAKNTPVKKGLAYSGRPFFTLISLKPGFFELSRASIASGVLFPSRKIAWFCLPCQRGRR